MSENIKIIDDKKQYLGVERMDTPFGTRHSGSLLTLTQEHIEALQSGKALLIDVEGEYVVSVKREESQSNITSTDANHMHNLEPKLSFGEKLFIGGFALFVAFVVGSTLYKTLVVYKIL